MKILMIQKFFRITKEEVEEEMAMMHKEAEMSVEELKAMYAKMAEDSANVETEEKVSFDLISRPPDSAIVCG